MKTRWNDLNASFRHEILVNIWEMKRWTWNRSRNRSGHLSTSVFCFRKQTAQTVSSVFLVSFRVDRNRKRKQFAFPCQFLFSASFSISDNIISLISNIDFDRYDLKKPKFKPSFDLKIRKCWKNQSTDPKSNRNNKKDQQQSHL